MSKQKNHAPAFKAKVALDALSGEKTIADRLRVRCPPASFPVKFWHTEGRKRRAACRDGQAFACFRVIHPRRRTLFLLPRPRLRFPDAPPESPG